MLEELALIILWIAVSLLGLWALLHFLPSLIKFFQGELKHAKERVADSDTETMVIKVKKEPKKEK